MNHQLTIQSIHLVILLLNLMRLLLDLDALGEHLIDLVLQEILKNLALYLIESDELIEASLHFVKEGQLRVELLDLILD